jgi:hypothetical protein
MDEFNLLIDLLEASIKKNGDKPLTLSHLLNMLKMVRRRIEADAIADIGVSYYDLF